MAAIAPCWTRFRSPNSSAVPISLCISVAKVSKSLLRAANLAFSKLKDLPSNNSASNSAVIEVSNYSKPSAIPDTFSKDKPNLWASIAALVKPSTPPFTDNLIALLTFKTFSRTFLSFIKIPVCAL